MINTQKCEKIYGQFLDSFREVASGREDPVFPSILDRVYTCFLNGYVPTKMPQSDYQAEIVKSLAVHGKLVSLRRDLDVVGSLRQVSMEKEAFDSLVHAVKLGRGLVLPFLKDRQTNISNRILHDVHNLGFAYLEAIVNSTSDHEFLEEPVIVDAKSQAVKIAKEADRVGYELRQGYSPQIHNNLGRRLTTMDLMLRHAHPDLLRAFETVATSPKKLSKKEESIASVRSQLLSENPDERYIPQFLIPIAQGGNELGIKLSNSYEDMGVNVPTYPIMYSIKTRNQRSPKIKNESVHLAKHLHKSKVLVTEDWVTTGNTLRGALVYFEHALPTEIRIATIKRDPEQSKVPIFDKYKFYTGASAHYTGHKNDTLPGAPTTG